MIQASRKIAASFPSPRFYDICREDLRVSEDLFARDPRIRLCRAHIRRALRDDLGHGVEHAEKVSIEAGALVYREAAVLFAEASRRREASILAQVAGLLHDLCRGEKNHARASALAAKPVLNSLSLQEEEGKYILAAIANHEAFAEPQKLDTALGQSVSDALYDADKFRWGPDNFTVTLWKMLRFSKAPIPRLISRFPRGMKGILEIRDTFRTATGRKLGPEFIDLGLKIGEEIHKILRERFAKELGEGEGER
jgi:hypothetical protein